MYSYTLTMKNQREIKEKSIRRYQNFTERDKTPEEWAFLCSVTQLCPTLCNSLNCSLPGSSVHVIFQARILEWKYWSGEGSAIPFSRGIFPTQGSNPGLLYCRQILYHLSYQVMCIIYTRYVSKTFQRNKYGRFFLLEVCILRLITQM